MIKIIPKFFLKKRIILNAHPGVLPINRGLDSFKWGVIKKYPFGVTLHKIDEKIDKGLIVCAKYIKINKQDTLRSIAKKSFENECSLLICFEKYLKNLRKKLEVSDKFLPSEERIPMRYENKLNYIFKKNRNKFIDLFKEKTFEIK